MQLRSYFFDAYLVAIDENGVPADDWNIATSLADLTLLLQDQGAFTEAGPLVEHALLIREKVLVHNHPYLSNSLNSLALLFRSQGNLAEALPVFKRSLTIRKTSLGGEHPSVVVSLHNLAGLHRVKSDFFKARSFSKQGLKVTLLHPDNNLSSMTEAEKFKD